MSAEHCVRAFKSLQDELCKGLETLDGSGARFSEDVWSRPGGGGGRSRTFTGDLIEKGGVGFSEVFGTLSPAAAESLGTAPGEFVATGVSIVLHPHNPWMPIIHMNVRYFELEQGQWWFGGGIDLTPHYIIPALARQFHGRLKAVCDRHEAADYESFKSAADDYFYLPHREETRGVGGIFYDRVVPPTFEEGLALSLDVGRAFVPCYADQAEALRERSFGESHQHWQHHRRGRYVEFNLVWDRGTKFGLQTNGRTESILMSMPPRADWTYDLEIGPNSLESETQSWLRKGVDWLSDSLLGS